MEEATISVPILVQPRLDSKPWGGARLAHFGIDLGGSKIEIAVLDGAGQVRARRRVPTPAGDYDATIAAIGSLVVAIENEIAAGRPIGGANG